MNGSTVVATPSAVAAPRPTANRDRYFDLLRAVAIVRVVVNHMAPAAWLSLVFPSMGVMFALGGSLMARSVDRGATEAITGRFRRLLPAYWVMGVLIVPAMLWTGWSDRAALHSAWKWVVPLAEPPVTEWAADLTGVLWYLAAYLWLVVLSPPLLWMYRRRPIATVVTPLLALAVAEYVVAPPIGESAASVLTDVLTFASCWVLGFAHRDGDLQRIRLVVAVPVALACTGGVLAYVLTQHVELSTVPFAYGVYSVGFVLVLMRVSPPTGWLQRSRVLGGLVNVLNARAVTIYLWHNTAIWASIPLGDRLEVWRFGGDTGYVALAVVLLLLVVPVLGWVEDVSARRPVRLVPWRPAPPAKRRPVKVDWAGPTY